MSLHKGMTTIERAFQIARSGQSTTVEEIKRLLSREGFNQDLVSGRLLRKQLQQLMLAAMAAGPQHPRAAHNSHS